MMKNLLLTMILLITSFCGANAQTTYYVKSGGTGNGSSWANASGDLQNIIDNAVSGDNVFVEGGTYQPATNGSSFSMKEGVKIYGGFAGTESSLAERDLSAGDSSILKGNGSTVIYNNQNDLTAAAVLDGFTVTGGVGITTASSTYGGGMYNDSVSPTISHVIFNNNSVTGQGGGMFNGTCNSIITNVIFSNNFAGNSAAGVFNFSSSPKFTNVIFDSNKVGSFFGGAAYNQYYSFPTFTNVTFINNSAPQIGGAIINLDHSTSVITNSIFWGNTAGLGADIYNLDHTTDSAKVNYSYTQTVIIGTGNVLGSSDPFLNDASPAGADGIYMTADDGLNIAESSAAYNAGNNDSIPSGITTDITGASRIQFGTVDMGAYESKDGIKRIYVDSANVSGLHDGSTWATAFNKFEDGIAAANADDTIWVAKGTYQPATSGTSFSMKEGVAIYGGFAGTETSLGERDLSLSDSSILKGNGSSVVYNNNNSLTAAAVLDGFTITGGNAGYGGGMQNYTASPMLTNITFTKDTASTGGGMYNYASSPTLTNVTFAEDTASTGGGMYNSSSSPTLTNVAFINNNSSDQAAGMVNYYVGSAILKNVTFINNNSGISGQGGGILNYESSLTITDAIFSNNTAGDGGGILNNLTLSTTLTNVVFANNSATNGGGGIENLGSFLTLNNVTFANNSAGSNYGGAIYNNISNPYHVLISNSVFWGNTAGTGVDIYNYTGSIIPAVTYTYTQTAIAGTGNIQGTTDPFINDANPAGPDGKWMTADDGLDISAASGTFNAGDNGSIPAGITTDITGAPRIVNTTVDMGAYENQTGALPLKLISFTAAKQNNTALLNWQTADEINTNYFNVQRSTDATHFTTVGQVAAKGNSYSQNDYSYTDDIANLNSGVLYYRLQMVDRDGHFTFSKIVSIHIEGEGVQFDIHPNPAHNYFVIEHNDQAAIKDARVLVRDMAGRTLINQQLNNSICEKINITGLSKGIYMVSVITGKKVQTKKLVVE